MHFQIVKMYKDTEVNKNVKHIFFINVWRKSVFDIYLIEFGTALATIYLFCSNIVIHTVIVTAGTFKQ